MVTIAETLTGEEIMQGQERLKVTCNKGVFYYMTLKNVVEALKTTRSTVLNSIREKKLCLGDF